MSDNHAYMDEHLLKHASEVDEVWHAGDWLSEESVAQLQNVATVRGVYGNVDSHVLRKIFPEELHFDLQGVRVCIRHIAGYPGHYNHQALAMIKSFRPQLFVTGHSHILKIVRDPLFGHLHINPGACGIKGFHLKRTFVRIHIESGRIFDVRVVETA